MEKKEMTVKAVQEEGKLPISEEFREISPADFFYRNRDLAGFSNPTRALYSAVRELLENSLDACELYKIPPEIYLRLSLEGGREEVKESNTYRIRVMDNGSGVPSEHIPSSFGQILFGSKYRLRQVRGTFGLGGKMAILYGQITTHSSANIISSVGDGAIYEFDVRIDIQRNRPEVLRKKVRRDKKKWRGTIVEFSLEGNYVRAMPRILEYLRQTAMVNPYAEITFIDPSGRLYRFESATSTMPEPPRETLPHPYGCDVELLRRIIDVTKCTNMLSFMTTHFHRVGKKTAQRFLDFTLVSSIIRLLKEEYPDAKIALNYSNPLELLIATMLSAQCTDKRVNQVTRDLFKKYRKAQDYADAELEELKSDIKPTGFYRNKTKNIKNCCRMLVERFDSKVPENVNDLLQLPGVARKTANMVLSNAYGVVEGIAVDTHIKRLAQRLGLTKNKAPEKIEYDLMEVIPKEEWFPITYLLIEHGRKICTAKRPKCTICVLNKICPSAFTKHARILKRKSPKKLSSEEIVRIVQMMKSFDGFLPPDAACLSPLGKDLLEAGIRKVLKPEFVYVEQRSPSAYSGYPFIVEVGIAYGGDVPASSGITLYRFANKIPLLYDEAGDVARKVINGEINWRYYKIAPNLPVAIVSHICSTKVPYRTVGKEFIADRPEIEREIKAAIKSVARRLRVFLSKKIRIEYERKRIDLFSMYLPKVAKFSTDLAGKRKVPDIKPLLRSMRRYGEKED